MSERPPKSLPRSKKEEDASLEEHAKTMAHVLADPERARMVVNDLYDVFDSLLDGHSQFSYWQTFRNILPKGEEAILPYLQKNIHEAGREGKAVAMDCGGRGVELFGGVPDGLFKKTLGVVLADDRGTYEKYEGEGKLNERKTKHTVLQHADLMNIKTYDLVREWLGGDKVDVIFERMMLGLNDIPLSPRKFGEILQIWYEMLNEGGVMFIQLPHNLNGVLEAWAGLISGNHGIEFQYELADQQENTHRATFRLRKLAGAPEKLPLISKRALYRNSEKSPHSLW